MTSTDDILNQIDAALGDTSVGPDAMRCGPAPEVVQVHVRLTRVDSRDEGDDTTETVAEPTGVWIAPEGTTPDDDTEWERLDGVTSVTVTAEVADVPTTPTDSDRGAARLYLIGRLVANHGLNSFEAGDAVDEAAAGLDGPHTHLARAEAQAAIEEAVAPIRAAMRSAVAAMRPATENAARAMQQLAEAAQAAAGSGPDDFALAPPQLSRPADWTPCGPKPRRRP